jgi:hypothetical protein
MVAGMEDPQVVAARILFFVLGWFAAHGSSIAPCRGCPRAERGRRPVNRITRGALTAAMAASGRRARSNP